MTDPDRITALETMIAHQARQIDDLSEMTAKAWAEIDQLKRIIHAMRDQMADVAAAVADGKDGKGSSIADIAAANKPPHY